MPREHERGIGGEPAPRPLQSRADVARDHREHDMDWARDNLGSEDPRELQERGLNVLFAPFLKTGVEVVSLRDGHVDEFQREEHLPPAGYFAERASLVRYCRERGLPMQEVDGAIVVLPTAGEAGDPLEHGGHA